MTTFKTGRATAPKMNEFVISSDNETIPHREKLSKDTCDRYLVKLVTINNTDPHNLSWSADSELMPPASSPDIMDYLVYGITADTLKMKNPLKFTETSQMAGHRIYITIKAL